ncbi:9312_t:CDS:1, partial [Ambispora gerdemannii]
SIEIKVYLDKQKGKEPEKAHNIDTGFDLRFPEDKSLEVKPEKIAFID